MDNDTIAAISTAPGRAAVALVRASGAGVEEIIARSLAPGLPERRPALRWLVHPDTRERIDRILATYFKAPKSFTGEDMLELSCHGGPLVPQLVLSALQAAGARAARPGEFTRRAYLNGKIDLLQAEAILDLVEGRTAAQHRAALEQLDRGLSRRIEELRDAIIRCEALLVYDIDFPEEDDGPVAGERIDQAARQVVAGIQALLETAAEGELLREGALTVIAGRPNAGKSSLFNALCGFERAIVTEEPGTTRDAVEAMVSLGGYPFRLVDTAGLRRSGDRVESLGIEVARRYLAGADLVLFCAEAGRALSDEEVGFLAQVERGTRMVVRTKSDLAERRVSCDLDLPEVEVSTVSGSGLGALRDLLVQTVFSGGLLLNAEYPLVRRERHARDLARAGAEMDAFLQTRSAGVAPEVAATHLRTAAQALEELLGVIAPDELLARVFADFCIGK